LHRFVYALMKPIFRVLEINDAQWLTFVPHITLSRIRTLTDINTLKKVLESDLYAMNQTIEVTQFHLFESLNNTNSRKYNILRTYKLS